MMRWAILLAALCACAQRQDGPRIGRAIGVLVAQDYTAQDTVRIYNDDGSLWHRFSFYYDDRDGKFDFPKPEFLPRAFNPDQFELALDVVADKGQEYRVVVNTESGLEKVIRKARFLRFLTWDKYVLQAFAVGFDQRANPIRNAASAAAPTTEASAEGPFLPVRTDGDWLQIKWGTQGQERYGWIRWRDGDRLIVEVHQSD